MQQLMPSMAPIVHRCTWCSPCTPPSTPPSTLPRPDGDSPRRTPTPPKARPSPACVRLLLSAPTPSPLSLLCPAPARPCPFLLWVGGWARRQQACGTVQRAHHTSARAATAKPLAPHPTPPDPPNPLRDESQSFTTKTLITQGLVEARRTYTTVQVGRRRVGGAGRVQAGEGRAANRPSVSTLPPAKRPCL